MTETERGQMISQQEYGHLNGLTHDIIGAAMEVHRLFGPGLVESVYHLCLSEELKLRGLSFESEVEIPLIYKGKDTGKTFRIDLLVEKEIIVELKAVDELKPVHEVQLLTYLKLTGKKLGLLVNFNVPILKQGIKRRINGMLEYKGIKPIRPVF